MSKIGIGIVTFNRLEYLERVVAGVKAHTTSDYELVVADDGSSDGTADWCRANDIRVIAGANGGVCWNKNRALFALQEIGCDPILLLEDDCIPARDGWDWEWRIATALFGHVAFAHPKLDPWLISGSGTPTDPYVNNKATAQCSSASGIALSEVGFFDTRFKGYGVGHAEWTTRMKRAGHGFKRAIDKEGREVKANLYIVGGLVGDDAPTFKDKANIARNEKLFEELKKEPVYRHPWSDEEEKARFLGEQKKAGVGSNRYMALNASDEDRDAGVAARSLRPYTKAFRRVFGDAGGGMRSTGWMSSIALGLPIYNDELAPQLAYPVIDLLKERIKPEFRVATFGAELSTIWWSRRVAAVDVAGADEQALARLQGIWPPDGAAITVVTPSDPAREADAPYDLVIVNGGYKLEKADAVLARLAKDGVLIVGNSSHRDQRGIVAKAAAAGFRELKLRAPTPMSPAFEASSIFYRAENCLGI